MHLTHHAQQRIQQRGIPLSVVTTVSLYGRIQQSHGATVMILDKGAIAQAYEDFGHQPYDLNKYRGVYIVEAADGSIITVARATKRRVGRQN